LLIFDVGCPSIKSQIKVNIGTSGKDATKAPTRSLRFANSDMAARASQPSIYSGADLAINLIEKGGRRAASKPRE